MSDGSSYSKIYGILQTEESKKWIALQFQKAGWSMRPCAWTDYEIESDVGDFVIEGDGEILLHGSLANFDEHLGEIVSILDSNDIGYRIEQYNEAGDLITEVRSGHGRAGP